MKKLLLMALICCVGGAYAQQIDKAKYQKSDKAPKTTYSAPEYSNSSQDIKSQSPAYTPPEVINKDVATVNPIEIGQAGNTWGFSYMRTTYLWVANEINSISFMHRMLADPGTGFLAYDLSTDGGQNWSVNNQVYDPTLPEGYNARYPQGVLYNPPGNTDPDNAYFTYFAPTLDGSNAAGGTNWGGYCWGTAQLAVGSQPTQHNQPSSGNMHQFLPPGMELTGQGEIWTLDEENTDVGGAYVYTDNLILGHGVWNDVNSEFDFEFEHFPLEVYDDKYVNDAKIAFSPDGMTGWMVAMTQLPEELPQTTMHPVLFRTEDGGETWEDDPIEVQLGGEDGIQEIVNFISDETLVWFYDPEPVPPRDEIDYFMGFHVDIAVDAWGNPHLCGLVAIADAETNTWWHAEGVMAEFHIWSEDEGDTWQGHNLYNQKRFDVEFSVGGNTTNMYNRPQVGTSADGAIVFFSFLDTDIEEVEDNSQPDIYFSDFQPALGTHLDEAINVTAFSSAMWNARWGAMSRYVFTETDGVNYTCTIPWVYQVMTDEDPGLPVQFWYIPDFVRTYAVTGVHGIESDPMASVAQNYPNPFSGTTNIRINLLSESPVEISVYSLTGQLVNHVDYGQLTRGIHDLELNAGNIDQGLYFFTVKAGESEVTRKMIIQ